MGLRLDCRVVGTELVLAIQCRRVESPLPRLVLMLRVLLRWSPSGLLGSSWLLPLLLLLGPLRLSPHCRGWGTLGRSTVTPLSMASGTLAV